MTDTLPPKDSSELSRRSRTVGLILAVLLGVFGAHRFYAGRTRSGVLMALTLGGAGLWWLYDITLMASGEFRDIDGRRIVAWEPDEQLQGQLPMELLQELDQLRRDIGELQERADFTERLLSNSRQHGPGKPAGE